MIPMLYDYIFDSVATIMYITYLVAPIIQGAIHKITHCVCPRLHLRN